MEIANAEAAPITATSTPMCLRGYAWMRDTKKLAGSVAYDGYLGGFCSRPFVQWVLCDEAEFAAVPVMPASHTLVNSLVKLEGKAGHMHVSCRRWGDHPTDDGACWSQWPY